MKRFWLLVWFLIPVPLLYYHFSAGQSVLALESVRTELTEVYGQVPTLVQSGDREGWQSVAEHLSQLLEKVPVANQSLRRELELDRLMAKMYAGDLLLALRGIEAALAEAYSDGADPAYIKRLNDALARVLFGIGWVMRLEGSARTEWQEVVELSRQQFRMLAEAAPDDIQRQLDLESSVQLLLMDRAEIKANPIPKEARNGRGRGVGDQMRRRGEGEGKGPPSEGPGKKSDSQNDGAGLEELARKRGS